MNKRSLSFVIGAGLAASIIASPPAFSAELATNENVCTLNMTEAEVNDYFNISIIWAQNQMLADAPRADVSIKSYFGAAIRAKDNPSTANLAELKLKSQLVQDDVIEQRYGSMPLQPMFRINRMFDEGESLANSTIIPIIAEGELRAWEEFDSDGGYTDIYQERIIAGFTPANTNCVEGRSGEVAVDFGPYSLDELNDRIVPSYPAGGGITNLSSLSS